MPNILNSEKQTAVISNLAEGMSIRSVERITGIHRDTIMRLGVSVGKGCSMVMDSTMRNLNCRALQFDEIWGFVGSKQKNADRAEPVSPIRAFVNRQNAFVPNLLSRVLPGPPKSSLQGASDPFISFA
jgi:hypothetical protein